MGAAIQGELVAVTTGDYLRLHGLYCSAKTHSKVSVAKGSVDSAVLIHGLAGNFYNSRLMLHFAQALMDLGVNVVLINTRGHEMINTVAWSGKAQSVGAALENVDDCRHDVNAWVDYLVMKRGSSNVLLFGHSLGAIKSLYAQAYAPHPNVRSMVGLSATRLSYAKLMESPQASLFRETIERCEALIANDLGEQPIQVPYPFPTWMTPSGYLDKYGPAEKFNWLRFIDRVSIPTLLLFGSRELDENPAFAGLADELEQLKAGWNSLNIETIPDADHFYSSKFGVVEDSVTRWLTR